MSFIRPEARATLWRLREIFVAAAVALAGLWLALLGGLFLLAVGGLVIALAAGVALLGLRRLRFAQIGVAPGVVEVDEGQISYLGPAFGGSISVPELVELRLLTAGGRRMWRLKQADGQALLIPVEAVGADRLFDAFSALPGLDTQDLVKALAPNRAPNKAPNHAAGGNGATTLTSRPDSRVIWQRSARVVLT
tara:strand:+ start:3965 stop:4543 length:579 start_codon:yes stop_codon:yes gene_type:complete